MRYFYLIPNIEWVHGGRNGYQETPLFWTIGLVAFIRVRVHFPNSITQEIWDSDIDSQQGNLDTSFIIVRVRYFFQLNPESFKKRMDVELLLHGQRGAILKAHFIFHGYPWG